MATVTRRRRSEPEDEETREERPSRRRSRDEDEEERDTPRRSRRSPSGDDKGAGVADEPRRRRPRDEDDEEEERPRRGRSRSRDEDEDERPSRGGSRRRSRDSDEDEDRPRRRSRASGGFSSYAQKKSKTSNFADDFKPGPNSPTLIKFLDAEPFDNYVQHWVEEGNASGKTRHSFVCRDDEYFDDEDGCPLCDIGEPGRTFSLFNVLDLTNPRKPEVKVWNASPAVADKLLRASQNERTSPLDREDVYFEVEMVKTKNKTEWTIAPVKARDLLDDFDIEPFTQDEIDDFKEKRYDDRKAVTKVDSYDELMELAESLD